MDGTRGIDRSKPIGDQIIKLLDSRYHVPMEVGVTVGGDVHYHGKVAKAIYSLMSDYFYKNPQEAKPYVED